MKPKKPSTRANPQAKAKRGRATVRSVMLLAGDYARAYYRRMNGLSIGGVVDDARHDLLAEVRRLERGR